MAELVWLDDLVRPTNPTADHRHWVLQCYAWDGCIHQRPHKLQSLGLFDLLAMEMAGTTDRKVGAWWVGNHQIPPVTQNLANITLYVRPAILGRQEIATPCLMP
jgi:hypothetical protein